MSPVERDRCRDSQRTYGRRGVFLYFISGLVSAAWGEALCSSGSRHRAPVGAAAQCCKAESTPPRRTVGVDMVVALAQHHGSDLSLELGGKRTSLLAHQTPLSRRGFLPKSVSGISGPLQAPPLFRSVKYKHQ